jgi:hypothetical protein
MKRKLFTLATLLSLLVTPLVSQITTYTARRVRSGPTLPATCSPAMGELFWKTTGTIGLYTCPAPDTWVLLATGAGTGDVLGPATNTDTYIPQWDGANSKTLKNGLAVASANTPSAVVARDASGNFAAGTITAALTGTASGNEVPLTFSGGVTRAGNSVTRDPLVGGFGTTLGSLEATAPVLVTGLAGYARATEACTITGWSIEANGTSPTATFDIWKVASGATLPTNANTITKGAEPALAADNAIKSVTLTGWTTTVAANDIIGFNLDAVTVATWAHLTVFCSR